jgi:hypothetical protein
MIPSDPLWLLLLGGAAVIAMVVALSSAALRIGRTTPGELARGLRNGVLIAFGLLVTVAAVTMLLTNMTPEGALALGLLLGGLIAGGYLAVGALVMVIGLGLRHSERWAARDSWLVAPVVAVLGVAAVGFASGMNELANRPMTRAGTISASVQGDGIGQLRAEGQARCTLDDENLAVHAGAGEGTTLRAADGTRMMIQLGVLADGQARLLIGAGGVEAQDGRSPQASLRLADGSGSQAGSITFSGLAPLDPDSGQPITDTWSGNVAWQCSF